MVFAILLMPPPLPSLVRDAEVDIVTIISFHFNLLREICRGISFFFVSLVISDIIYKIFDLIIKKVTKELKKRK